MHARSGRATGAALLLGAFVASGCGDGRPTRARTVVERPASESVRVTMDVLHRMGGVPPRWQLTPPPGDPKVGRAVFIDYGCPSCHVVAGDAFDGAGAPAKKGPELTGMGTHHPAAYFVEALLNPNAVLIEGEGYTDELGRSTMPAYPMMTLEELADVVAYLQSLTIGGHDHAAHVAMGHMPAPGAQLMPSVPLPPVPKPPEELRGSYIVMTFDVLPGKLDAFVEWFRTEGRAQFFAIDGVTAVETWVDTTRTGGSLVSWLRFRDGAALARFLNEDSSGVGEKWDEFVGPHGHYVYAVPPIYVVPALTAAAGAGGQPPR